MCLRYVVLCSALDPQEKVEASLLNDVVSMPSKKHFYQETKMDKLELPLFDFTTLSMATNNFSDANKLGHGGFGSVYKVEIFCTNITYINFDNAPCEHQINKVTC